MFTTKRRLDKGMILELDITYAGVKKHFRFSSNMRIGDAAQEVADDFGIELNLPNFKDRFGKRLDAYTSFNNNDVDSGEELELIGHER